MRSPSSEATSPAWIRRAKQLLDRTKPLTEVAGPVATYETAVTSYENRYNEWALAKREQSVAFGVQNQAAAALDQELRGVGLAILTVGRGRRKFEVYRRYFPDGYGSTLKLLPAVSLATAAGLLQAMEDETDPTILARREPLTTARAQLQSAMTARQVAMDARSQAKATLEEEKLAWRKAHSAFYFALRAYYFDRRSFVESLFDMNGNHRSEDGVQPQEKESAAQPAGTDPPAAPEVAATDKKAA